MIFSYNRYIMSILGRNLTVLSEFFVDTIIQLYMIVKIKMTNKTFNLPTAKTTPAKLPAPGLCELVDVTTPSIYPRRFAPSWGIGRTKY